MKSKTLHLVTRESASPALAEGDLVVRIGVRSEAAPQAPLYPEELDAERLLDLILATERLIVW